MNGIEKLTLKNIRAITGLDDTELRESLKLYGWHQQFPALADENDVVLVGHRRMRLAKQLGIEPVIRTITFGDGEAANAERVKLALISNIGSQPLSKDDRKRIAEYLYGTRTWTMERIAEALDVTTMTVSNDLRNFKTDLKLKPAKTASNPKGAGRPKGRRSVPKRHREADTIVAAADAGLTTAQIAAKTGVSERTVRREVETESIRREAQADPVIDPATLSISAQQKLDAAVRQHKKMLDAQFEDRVHADIVRLLRETILPERDKKYEEHLRVIKARKGIYAMAEFNLIRSCLHIDSRKSVSDDKLNKAFQAFDGKKQLLVAEAEAPTPVGPRPKTYEELMKLKEQVRQQRKGRRNDLRPR